jgi:hypothetical protein
MACDGGDEKRKERAREKTRKFFDRFHEVSSRNKDTAPISDTALHPSRGISTAHK